MALKFIIGLGNPGARFERTRHNIGFRILDHAADQFNASWKEEKNYLKTEIEIEGERIALIKPQTFMNNSGDVIKFLNNARPENIIAVYDDMETLFGKIKSSFGGSAKGHNGVKSLIEKLGTQDFERIKFGISRPEKKEDVPDYVLEKFNPSEELQINNLLDAAWAEILKNLNKK